MSNSAAPSRPSISGEVHGYRYTVDSHSIVPLPPDEEGETAVVTNVEITNLRVSWDPDDHTTVSVRVDSGTLTSVQIPDEGISDFEYILSNLPQGLDNHARDDVVQSILEGLGLGKF